MMLWFVVVGLVVALATADLRRDQQIGMGAPAPGTGRVRRSDAALMRTLRGLHMEEWEPPGTLGAIAARDSSESKSGVATAAVEGVSANAQPVGGSGVLKPRANDAGGDVKHALLSVRVAGEVHAPGLLRVEAGTPVLAALMQAGGTTGKGSLRKVFLRRLGNDIELDMYQGLVDGPDASFALADGDEIRVPEASPTVAVGGKVKRPGALEVAKGDTVAKLVGYAGGASGATPRVTLTRKGGKTSKGTLAEAAKWAKLAGGEKIEVN